MQIYLNVADLMKEEVIPAVDVSLVHYPIYDWFFFVHYRMIISGGR